MAMEKERMAIGVRQPRRQEIEYAVMRNGVGDRLMPILADRYKFEPQRMFADMIPDRRLMTVRDGMQFHDAARAAGVQRWVIYQLGTWHEGPVTAKNPVSLQTRWGQYAATGGGDRFTPLNTGLTRMGQDGVQRHCIMGAAVELFRDDYPAEIVMVERPNRETRRILNLPDNHKVHVEYQNFDRSDCHTTLPNAVRRELGLKDSLGTFAVTLAVARAMYRHDGIPVERAWINAPISDNLVSLNDRSLNWPLIAEIMAEPSAKVFGHH